MPDETDLDKSYESIFKMKSFNREQAVSNLNRIIEMKDRKYSNFKSGNIVLEDFSYSYINKPPILKNLSLEIESGQKIGIIGRTGAGKSSLISALYRIRNPATGKIIFDGQDEIDLHSLRMGFKNISTAAFTGVSQETQSRKNLSIIPQEPIIFSDTIRGNLDPFGEYEDSRIWNVLQSVGLKNKVSLLPNGLGHILNEGGANLSGRFSN